MICLLSVHIELTHTILLLLYNIAMDVSIKVVVMGTMNATTIIGVYIMIKMIVRGDVVLQGWRTRKRTRRCFVERLLPRKSECTEMDWIGGWAESE